jgi:hypothetical protein
MSFFTTGRKRGGGVGGWEGGKEGEIDRNLFDKLICASVANYYDSNGSDMLVWMTCLVLSKARAVT